MFRIFKYIDDKCGVRGSRFGHIFGCSKNVPKNTAIDQESLISHLGMIKTLKTTRIAVKQNEKPTKTILSCRILDPIGPRFWEEREM